MLTISNLHAAVAGTPILKGLSLTVRPGEVHAIMGPNGSGKSTLSQVLSGREDYEVTSGEVLFEGRDLLALSPEERAAAGLFLAFQYPVEIPGVANNYFLRAALNATRKARGETEIDAYDFLALCREKMQLLEMNDEFKSRYVNVGFSGGEKKRNEILQLVMMNPKLAILDEIDSGLDVDALRLVAKGVNSLRDKEHSFILVTHYQRLLDYIEPDYVHILKNGRIARSGDAKLALEVEASGYADIPAEAGA